MSTSDNMIVVKLSLQEAKMLSGIPMSEWLIWSETRTLLGVPAAELCWPSRVSLVDYGSLMTWLETHSELVKSYRPPAALLRPTASAKWHQARKSMSERRHVAAILDVTTIGKDQ